MPPTKNRKLKRESSFGTIYDAIHGPIDLKDLDGSEGMGAVVALLSSPIVDRLRRIKQLGYASHSYLSADHSRHAHAIGTMYVMRTILRHLNSLGHGWTEVLSELKCFGRPKINTYENLVSHMLVASLLQDVGELPYTHSTDYFYKPSDELRESVAKSVGYNINEWHDKNIFTIGSIYKDTICLQLGLNLEFLTYLITGALHPDQHEIETLRALRHMLDGDVDADRLDYVFRDAHQTIGGRGTPRAVIESLLFYDDLGPIFSDPAPVTDFFTTRASLWTSVYFSAQNRFRILLLTNVLQGIVTENRCRRAFFPGNGKGDLSVDDFLELDDASLSERLRKLDQGKEKRGLNPTATYALDLLMGRGGEYECEWLPPTEASECKESKLVLPANLFFESYAEYQNTYLYKAGTVRVEAPRFSHYKRLVPLEECCGAFSQVFKGPVSVVERPSSILLFTPKEKSSGGWKQFQKAINDKTLFRELNEIDPVWAFNYIPDTRKTKGFHGPAVFISFNSADAKLVSRVAQALSDRKRRYYLYIKSYQGIGGTPGGNSIDAVRAADAVIIIASSAYLKKYQNEPSGNIGKEINEMSIRVKSESLPVVVLSVDPVAEIEKLPWYDLGFTEPAFTGPPLRNATRNTVNEAITEALKQIDSKRKLRQ